LFLDPALRAGSLVVTEGRAIVKDGDRVQAKQEIAEATPALAPSDRPVSAEVKH
jgi:hypothetical protein